MLEHHVRREVAELDMTRGGFEQRLLRNQTHDLAPRRRHAAGFGFELDRLEGAMQRCPLGIDEVHGDLGLAIDLESEAFYVTTTATRSTNGFGHLFRHGHV